LLLKMESPARIEKPNPPQLRTALVKKSIRSTGKIKIVV